MSGEDSHRFTTIAHSGFDILGPLSNASVDAMLDRLPVRASGLGVLDVGCGKAEILIRTLVRTGGRGIGVEPNPAFAKLAEERAIDRLGPDRVQLVRSGFDTSLLAPHAFDLGICTGALHAFGDWATTLRAMAEIVAPDGWALLGPGYWKQPPSTEYLAAIEAETGEQELLATTLAALEPAGWQMIACHESTPEEWDAYEHGYADNVRRWCDDHARDREAPAFRERIEKWAAAYEKWGRETMGYALVLMRRA